MTGIIGWHKVVGIKWIVHILVPSTKSLPLLWLATTVQGQQKNTKEVASDHDRG
jgi:hypothetical protein